VLTLAGAEIAEITSFLTPEAFERFGLPAAIEPSSDWQGARKAARRAETNQRSNRA
jgi:hypothetical protein